MMICRAGQSEDHSVSMEAAGTMFAAAWNGTYLGKVLKKLAEFWYLSEKSKWDGVGVNCPCAS